MESFEAICSERNFALDERNEKVDKTNTACNWHYAYLITLFRKRPESPSAWVIENDSVSVLSIGFDIWPKNTRIGNPRSRRFENNLCYGWNALFNILLSCIYSGFYWVFKSSYFIYAHIFFVLPTFLHGNMHEVPLLRYNLCLYDFNWFMGDTHSFCHISINTSTIRRMVFTQLELKLHQFT